LNQLKIWNVNDPDLLNLGAQNVIIDYSLDGINWTEFGQETFPQAPGISTYEGDDIVDFGGIKARYLLFTIVDNYGGEECTGFAEMRVAVDSTVDENADICITADVYPNPVANDLTVTLTKKCLGEVYLAIEDATGRTIVAENIIQLNTPQQFDFENFSPGVYFVCLRNGEIKERYKIVKQ